MSAEMVLWCLRSATAGPSKSRGVFGPVFVWGSRFGQRSSPSRDRDLKDLSRASAAFRNKLVGETMLYSGESQWMKRKFRRSLSHWIENVCSWFICISNYMYDTLITSAPYNTIQCLSWCERTSVSRSFLLKLGKFCLVYVCIMFYTAVEKVLRYFFSSKNPLWKYWSEIF